MSNECAYFKELIKEALAGELAGDKKAELNRHLAECPACSKEKTELAQVLQFLGEFEDHPVPKHFLVKEQPRLSLFQAARQLARGQRWAAAGIAAMVLAMFGLVLMNTHIRFQDHTLTVSLGDSAELYSGREVKAEIAAAVREAREEDRLMIAKLLDVQNQLLEVSIDHIDQRVDTRLREFQGRVVETFDSSNKTLKAQMAANLYQYGEMTRMQQQDDVRKINSRLDQLTLDGRRRETQNGAIMVALARYGLANYQLQGGIYE